MPLQEQIDQDLKKAMMAKDATTLSTLRFLKSALKYVAIDKQVDVLSDADIQQVIQKQIKQHRESLEQFKNAGRAELSDKEAAELKVLESYLPAQLSDAELEKEVVTAIQAEGASSKKDFGRVMKVLTAKLAGRVEARKISDLLGKKLPA